MKRVLCVIDYQVDFVTGSMGSIAADSIADSLRQRILEYRERGDTVIFTRDTHEPTEYAESCEGRHIPVAHCVKGTVGHQLDSRILPLSEGCPVIDKHGFGSFELADLVAEMSPDEIELSGVATNICVLSNAVMVRTACPNARVFVDRTCVASYDERLGEEALDVLSSICVDVL